MCNSTRDNTAIDQSRLNYEEQNQYKIRIQFSNQSESIEEDFFINIEDINEPPCDLQCCNQTGFCTALDEDFNQTLKFQIKTLNDQEYEIICTDNGQPPLSVSIRIKVLPDDMTLVFVPIYSLIIPVVDDDNNNTNQIGNKTQDKIAILYSIDGDKTDQRRRRRRRQRRQANSPPQDIYFDMFYLSVPENSRDFQIAHVYVLDDDPDDNYTCSIYAYNVPEALQPFEIVDGILQTSLTMHNNNYDLDYETQPVYYTLVTCTDSTHHFTISKNFSIDVSDVNEAPVELILQPETFPENSVTGYVIGQLSAIDPDIYLPTQTFTYTIITDPSQIFGIDNDTLTLTRDNDVEMCIIQPGSCPHDYEQTGSAYVRIRVEDDGVPPASQNFWVQVGITDENDPPVSLQLDTNLVPENSPYGTLVGQLSVQDEDLYQTHTFVLINETPVSPKGNFFLIEDNLLRVAQSPDFEQESYVRITVQATDNGTIPKSTTTDFIIEILDVDELPTTYVFVSNMNDIIPNRTINDLIKGKQPVKTVYLPQSAYFQGSLGRILFIMLDRDRDLTLNGYNNTNLNELGFSKPTCTVLSEDPYRLLCTSDVTIDNPTSVYDENDGDGHLIITPLVLTSNDKTMTFPKVLRIKFENITLTINGEPTESIDIPKDHSMGYQIGLIHGVDLAAPGQTVLNVTLNSNNSLSYPLEIVNSTILKVRDNVNLSSINSPTIFNVSVLVTIIDDDNRIVEKYLVVNVIDETNFTLTLSNNKIMENSYENTLVGNFILEGGVGNYTMDLIDNANGQFKLDGTSLLSTETYVPYCHTNHTCPYDHETEPIINITIAVRDPSTNQTLRLITFPIETQDENEAPYNLTLSIQSIPENATIGSIVSIINAMDDDFDQTLTYTTTSPTFNIINNQLILKTGLNYDQRQYIPVTIRATDNGNPPLYTEKLFIMSIFVINRPPTSVSTTSMIVFTPPNTGSAPLIIEQMHIVDPDIRETFTITFNNPDYLALTSTMNSYSLLSDDGLTIQAQVYNVSIVDLSPPINAEELDYFVNVTANVTDSANHSITHEFFVHYVPKIITNLTVVLTTASTPPTTTTTLSLSQALHVRIYETTPPNTPIIRGLLSSSSSNSPPCTAVDDEGYSFPINATRSAFIIYLPNNYTLNSTIRPTILVYVQCNIGNSTNVHQSIVIDVLPAPPTVQINFNQTTTFYATGNINNDTILGTVSLMELTTTPTNRTYKLSLTTNQNIFKLLPNGSLIQIGPYPSVLLQSDNPHVDLTIRAIETTPNEPTRIIQKTFSVPITVISSTPFITFSQTSIPNDTNPNTIILNMTIHNLTIPYTVQLTETYNNGLALDPTADTITLKRPVNTFPLINNQTQLLIKTALVNATNGTILAIEFPLNITYRIITDPCANKDCGNGICISSNQTSPYCLCTAGYRGSDCRIIDPCAYNPCTNNGVCRQISSAGDFSCQCLPNHSGSLCEILIDVCQVNTSSCSSTDICIAINNDPTNFFTCIPKDELQYLVFDYLNDYKNIDVINDQDLLAKMEDFIKNNLLPIENLVLPDRKTLGPVQYDRAALMSVAILIPNQNMTALNNALGMFCGNQSLIIDSFAREICAGYQQAVYLGNYFKSTPDFCPNCTFVDAADKYYWFDKVVPFLPLWITLIIGALLMTAIPLIPFNSNAPKKVALPLMKAKTRPEDEQEENAVSPVLAKSVRSAAKISSYSSRERTDSGYESNEDDKNNYLEQIINNYQQQQQQLHVYPIFHGPRSPTVERRDTIADELTSSDNISSSRSRSSSNIPRRYTQRSASVSVQKARRQSSVGQSQTLKPILHHRASIFDSSIGTLIRLTGMPRLLNEDETYLSTRFRNENTSKFVIGTLWNTFALVNNLFLQRPRKRRNAIFGEANIQADQLAHLQELYSLAERDQANEHPIDNLQSIITEVLLEPETTNLKTNHLQSVIAEILLSTKGQRCTCYGNHHVPSCIYYDHSLPYLKRSIDNISELEKIFYDLQKSTKPKQQDATTQSNVEKPRRSFTHFKPTNNAATQSSPILHLKQLHFHVSTQYSPIEKKNTISTQFNSKEIDHNYINISTQTIKTNNLNNISTQFSPQGIENNESMNILTRLKTKPYDHTYINTSTQYSPKEIKPIKLNIPTQHSPKETKLNIPTQFNTKKVEDNNIYDQRNSLMNELKQVFSSLTSKQQIIEEEKPSLPNRNVRSLVSMFETTLPTNKSNLIPEQKSSTNNLTVLTSPPPPPDLALLNISTEEIHTPIIYDTIENYANEIATHILDNAVLTATTTTVYHDEQLHRRFSLYKNGAGYGKSLLFQTNTFLPSTELLNQEEDHNFRAESQSSTAISNDLLTSTIPIHTDNESRHTLIVGRHIDGDDSIQSKAKERRSLNPDTKVDPPSSDDDDNNDDDEVEQIDHRQFLSNSELFSAHELYIRPWLVRRATAPDIHCLDTNISDTGVEIISPSDTFFSIFPRNNPHLDSHTRYTSLVTILLYLYDIHDEYSNRILYEELEQIENQFSSPILTPSMIHSNVFQTANPDGSKRYRTGFILDINSPNAINKRKILAKQIEWKRVKIILRRFRKKHQYYKQLMKDDQKIKSNQLHIENYLKYFDSTSKRRIKKYAKHYADKI